MAFQGADVTALKGIASACQKGAAAAGAVIKILKQVIAALRASANGPWVEPFIRSLEAVIKMLEMIVQRLNEFAKLLSMNASQQEQASISEGTVSGPGKSLGSPATTINPSPMKNITAAFDAMSRLVEKFTEAGKTQTSTVPAVESPVSNPAENSANTQTDTPASKSSGSSGNSGGNPGSSAPGSALPTGEPVAHKAQGSPQVFASSVERGAFANYTAPTGGLSTGIPLESAGKGSGLTGAGAIGVGTGVLAGLGSLGYVGSQLIRKTNPGETTENK